METVKKIDIHAHVTAFPEIIPANRFTAHRVLSAEELIGVYDKLNIEKGVLLPIVSSEGNTAVLSNEATKFVADKYKDNFFWFCNIDPRQDDNSESADLGYYIEHYKKLGAKGVGEITSNVYADDPKMDNLFGHCAKAKMPVIIHISPEINFNYGIVDEIGLPRIEKMLKKHPDLTLLGHSQPFWAEMSGDITEKTRNDYPTGKVTDGRIAKLMREYGNLYCDISACSGANAFMRDSDYAARFIEEFADRILYGCDICGAHSTFMFDFDKWLTDMVDNGMVSIENYKKIVRENAIKILGL